MYQEIGSNINNIITMCFGVIMLITGIVFRVKKLEIKKSYSLLLIIGGPILILQMAFTFV